MQEAIWKNKITFCEIISSVMYNVEYLAYNSILIVTDLWERYLYAEFIRKHYCPLVAILDGCSHIVLEKKKKFYNYEILWWPLSNIYLLRTESRRQRKMLRNDSTIYLHLTPKNLINEPTRYYCAKLARYIGYTCRCHYICISYWSENPTKFFCSRYIPLNRWRYCVP